MSVVHNLKAKAGQGPEERDEVERQSAAEEEAVDDNLEAAVEVVDNWEELPKIVIGVVIVVGGGGDGGGGGGGGAHKSQPPSMPGSGLKV